VADDALTTELRQVLLPCDRLACAKIDAPPCDVAECAERTRARLVGELREFLARDDDRLPTVYLADVLTLLEAERERVATLEKRLAEAELLLLKLSEGWARLAVLEIDTASKLTEALAPAGKPEDVN
jgi:hypothetical protein